MRIKRAVLAGSYAFSEKARLEMEADGLTELDIAGEYKGQKYVVPNLEYYICEECGEKIYPREAMRKIQAYSPAYELPEPA